MFDQLMKAEKAAVNKELSTVALVDDVDEFPELAELSVNGRRWKRIAPVVIVVADLKNSTKLGMGKNVNTTVRMYRAATTRGVGIMAVSIPTLLKCREMGSSGSSMEPTRLERAMGSAMVLAHFSKYILEPGVVKFLSSACPDTGLKIGVTDGTVAVSHLGVSGASNHVWAGKPVNWAFKCSAAADRHQVIVTRPVYDMVVDGNDYLTRPCYISGHPHLGTLSAMWTSTLVKSIGEWCMVRKDPWCEYVGDESCNALLAGGVR